MASYVQQVPTPFWNKFDDIALYINIYRRSHESNKDLATRYDLINRFGGGASKQGIINAILTQMYLEPDVVYENKWAILDYTPLSQYDCQRFGVSYIFEVTNALTGQVITDYTHYNDILYDKPTRYIYFSNTNINMDVRIRYRYFSKVDNQTYIKENIFRITDDIENRVTVYKLYNESEAIAAGVLNSINQLTKLGQLILSEIDETNQSKWGKFKWDWHYFDAVAVVNRQNILIKPVFDASTEGFDEYSKLS